MAVTARNPVHAGCIPIRGLNARVTTGSTAMRFAAVPRGIQVAAADPAAGKTQLACSRSGVTISDEHPV